MKSTITPDAIQSIVKAALKPYLTKEANPDIWAMCKSLGSQINAELAMRVEEAKEGAKAKESESSAGAD